MEYKGSEPNKIHGTLHYPAVSPGLEIPILRLNAASEFHIYKTIWTPTSVKIYVDDKLFHSVANDNSLPFTKISFDF
jgi:beta-glucanase (GH16 family)